MNRQSLRYLLAGIPVMIALGVAARASARADLHFPVPSVDVGEARSGAPLSHRFEFVNRSTAPVEITAIRAGCGCLTPRLVKRVYEPGESGSLLLEINTLSQDEGPHTWNCQVACQSAGKKFEVPLQLKGLIVAEVLVRPAVLTVFTETSGSHEIVLTDRRARPLVLTALRASSALLQPRLMDDTRNEQGHTIRRIRLGVSADWGEGRHEETLAIYTDDPLYRELKVPVTVVKRNRPRVTAAPASVALPADGSSVYSCLVRLRDRQEEGVVVEAVESDHPAITVTWAPGPEKQATLKVRVDRSRLAEDQSVLRVRLSQPARETVILPVVRLGQ